ncbi:centrosomal protein of 192 kDa isoform X1 [Osmerus mordax]|uniref:centrosomal protein of 192 kDa isoform X1 n=1 Tax=Osmerus mordax TaxID=8014 RepID=UPI00350FEC00
MMERLCNLEDEPIPSFLSESQGSSCANVTLGSTPGLPVAASTLAKVRPGVDIHNRVDAIEASYLGNGQLLQESSYEDKGKFALSFMDNTENADDFIAAHRFSDMLLKVELDESRSNVFTLGSLSQASCLPGQSTEPRTDKFLHMGNKDFLKEKDLTFFATVEKENPASTEGDDCCSGNDSSFLANEKLMSLDSMVMDITDDEIDMIHMNDYKLVPPAMQRGQVEGQEIPAEDSQMPDVRLAATGMDSCPASDEEDTEDELEAAKRRSFTRSHLLPSTFRHLIGESNRPNFRPGLEGGSSDDECLSGWNAHRSSGIEHRHSAEGQVINSSVPGDGGGGDGSSGSEESVNNERLTATSLPTHTGVQTTYDILRGLGIVGSGGVGEESDDLHSLPGLEYDGLPRHSEIGDRVGPVGTVEATSRLWDFSATAHHQGSCDWSQVLPSDCGDQDDNSDDDVEGVDEGDGAKPPLGMRGGPLGDSVPEPSDSQTEEEKALSTSLEPKYFSQSFHQEHSDDGWNLCPDTIATELQQGADENVVYQNEEGNWVTDLAYYSSFDKEFDANMPEKNTEQFKAEDFLPASNAIDKIIKDQEEFEKEHQFMQEEQIEVANCSPSQSDSSWKLPASGHILMRASQVSSEFETGNQSYLRLTLGEFFQQRSEALGCLGVNEEDGVRRPSFGYMITSPEKREPFALIRPSDFASRNVSVQSETVQLTDADHTMIAEDLEKTLENPSHHMSLKETADPEPSQKDQTLSTHHPDRSGVAGLGSANQTCNSPGNTSHQMLSISSIASAINDASISTDPNQLAAMIMELSKRRRIKGQSSSSRLITGSSSDVPFSPLERQNQVQRGQSGQSSLVDVLQRTTLAGEVNNFDMEKYLKKTDVSRSSDSETSGSPPNFELLSLGADSLHISLQDCQASIQHAKHGISTQSDRQSTTSCKAKDFVGANGNACHDATSNRSSQNTVDTPCNSRDSRRRSFPTSCMPTASTNPGPSFVDSRQPSTTKSAGSENELMSASCNDRHDVFHGFVGPAAAGMEENRSFRPSTSPLTHSSPSQTSITSADGSQVADTLHCETSPQTTCSSISRLTYISLNDSTCLPTPDKHKKNGTMSLSTTIVRASPTPPLEQEAQMVPANACGLHQSHGSPCHSKSPDQQRNHSKSPDLRCCFSLGCGRSQSECNIHTGTNDMGSAYGPHKHTTDPGVCQLRKVDSGYSSNLNIQQPLNMVRPPSQQWTGMPAQPSAFPGGGFGLSPTYPSEDHHHIPIPSFKPQGALVSFCPSRGLFSSQLPQQYLGSEGFLQPDSYHLGLGSSLYKVSSAGPQGVEASMRHHVQGSMDAVHGGLHVGYPIHHSHHSQQDPGILLGKPYSHLRGGPWTSGGLPELRDEVVVPEELRFPQACCVGIASQTSLSLFNPSERWQQVSISLTSFSIDGKMVDSLPYQLLIVKNKTIIGPRSTEEQKILFIPPQAGVYQLVLSVASWPASSEAYPASRAEVFSKKVVLMAIAENPALEIDVGKSGSLDFGDLAGGSAKALPLKLFNRTHATLPLRLVISANASARRCFTLSKSPVGMKSEEMLLADHATTPSAPYLINHVMHASYGENPECFMVWVHFHAPQKYASCTGVLGPPDEHSARVDIEVDCPGASHLITSIPLSARSGTARVHTPKDLQTVYLSALFGKSSQQTLPLKNAGNIDVQLKLKSSDDEDFSVKPDELSLRTGEEQGIVISFSAKGYKKYRESVLTILVQPSGPQYEVILKGEVIQENDVKTNSSSMEPSVVPPILSNKQFMAWGGVTLGRAVQQKLVLRNNSLHTTHQLRLLIRGQDQDCFQLQSMFGSEERLTRHRELSIRPREDTAVHLLFAPTRVACMLAKLEIKQSGVRPSQPGVKFTIPLSGYGGTSNIILEDLRKTSDGYVTTLTGVAAGHVSKVCVCVRNTGSRAAFIKAVAYSDLQKRTAAELTLISLSPSQFILKERTQEVITVLMKSTPREQAQCQSDNALLATICLFCGDEVSRHQFRKLLLSKPKAASNMLSENSLLKDLNFDERFLGEEMVMEAYDLPQRPNEAQIFFRNMSKVVLLLLGSVETSDSGESDVNELQQPFMQLSTESGSGFSVDRHISNVSLDVLPVKGPQGQALKVMEPFLKEKCERILSPSVKESLESWSIQPEQLTLTTAILNGQTNTGHIQIQNHSSRELSFELSWPAHCLTVTPQHGVIDPKCHLQIMISPNPSLSTKSALLPWSGQVYVHCDNQQKLIKVQIRQDLALDVSIAPVDRSLSALPPQAATPLVDPVRPQDNLLEITNRTVIFSTTASGETSESFLEVENGEEEVRWYISSFAPPYVKGVDNSGDVYRATYTAFRCSRVSGILGPREKMQVPVTFMPRDRGDYAQFWDLESHSVTDPQHKTRNRFQFCGTGLKAGPVTGPQEGDCSLVRTEAIGKTRKRADASTVNTCQEESPQRGVYSPKDMYVFPATRVGESSTLKVNLRNNSFDTHELRFVNPKEPFHIKHSKYSLRSQHYINLPVQFKPSSEGKHLSLLLIQSETSGTISIHLTGEALP